MHRVLLLMALLVAVTACSSPTDPVRTSTAGQGDPMTPTVSPVTPTVSPDSFWADDPGQGCSPPQNAAEGEGWLCVQESTPEPWAEQQRLAALARESGGWSEDEAQQAETERLGQVAAEDDAVVASGDLPADRGSLLIRTDFTDQSRWEALRSAVRTPSPEGFVPYLSTVEHQRWAGASAAEVAAVAPPYVVLVVADATALASPGAPLLVVQVAEGEVRELRVAPEALASVENNLSIANMDWEDFAGAVDPDGVFRGFH